MSTPPKRPGFRDVANRALKAAGQPPMARKSSVVGSGPGGLKINRNIRDRAKAKRDARARKKAEYLATLPKSRFKRILFRLNPKRAARYWFSREGAIMALKI